MPEEMTPEATTTLRNVYAFLLRRHYASLGIDSRPSSQPLPTTPEVLDNKFVETTVETTDGATA